LALKRRPTASTFALLLKYERTYLGHLGTDAIVQKTGGEAEVFLPLATAHRRQEQ